MKVRRMFEERSFKGYRCCLFLFCFIPSSDQGMANDNKYNLEELALLFPPQSSLPLTTSDTKDGKPVSRSVRILYSKLETPTPRERHRPASLTFYLDDQSAFDTICPYVTVMVFENKARSQFNFYIAKGDLANGIGRQRQDGTVDATWTFEIDKELAKKNGKTERKDLAMVFDVETSHDSCYTTKTLRDKNDPVAIQRREQEVIDKRNDASYAKWKEMHGWKEK